MVLERKTNETIINEKRSSEEEKLPTVSESEIKDFDPEILPEPTFRMALYGKTNCGKSHAMKAILSKVHRRFDKAYLFSLTADLQLDTYDYIPEGNKSSFLDLDKIQEIFDKQDEDFKRYQDKKKLKRILIILDDLISDSDIKHGIITKLFIMGRHFNISIMVTSQNVASHVSLAPQIRNNCEVLLSFSLFAEQDRKTLIERFGSVENKKIGEAFFKSITQNKYTACVFCTFMSEARLSSDYMFRYIAEEKIKKFKIGKTVEEYKSDDLIKLNVSKFDEPEDKKSRPKVKGPFSVFIKTKNDYGNNYL